MLMPESTANIWLLDEADCNEQAGRREPPGKGESKDNRKNKSKSKCKSAAKEKTPSARGQSCLRQRD
jgi:hypothetical protein